jgi:ElaB/YqjD/DUF883 family membrane-anchored ribosome-binding protein
VDAVDRALEARGNSIRTALDDRTRELNSMLAGRSAELSRLIDEKARPLVDDYAETGRIAAERISAAAQDSAERIRSENAALINAIASRTNDTLAAITARTENAAAVINAAENSLAGNVSSLIQRLSDSNVGIAELIGRATEELGSVVGRAAGELEAADRQLGATTARFSESASQAADLVSTSSRLLEGKIDRLSSISGDTLSQVSGIVGRFDDHSKVLGQASELLAAAQSNLVSTLDERQDALRNLSVGLVKRSEEIETTMRGLSTLVDGAFERAEERSAQVAGNLREGIQTSFTDIGRILSETEQRAQNTADTMRTTLMSAGEDANRVMEGTLASAEKRSGELANRLRGGLTSSLSDVEKLLGEAGQKSDTAADYMRDALRQAVEDAVQRFGGATDEIRKSASEIRKELDMTRAELKRGAFDLPEEAKESASAMRRAVAEQIKALQDISQLVGKSAQQLEVSEPVSRAAPQPDRARQPQAAPAAQQPAPAAYSAPAASQQPAPAYTAPQPAPTAYAAPASAPAIAAPAYTAPAEPRPAPVMRQAAQLMPSPLLQQPRQPAPPQPAQPRFDEPSGLRGALAMDRTIPTAPALAPPRATESARGNETGGWISDLLRGASRDEQADALTANRAPATRPADTAPQRASTDNRNPRHMVESLNSLSVDIARAIDHDASVDLWRRYQRGERDVFTRRLYTLKGQQTFDEIQRKYDREPEFRTAVDRYIADFEKLLADVARTDRDKSVTQSYLTSDTGKVYTMLAHAAGRFS